MLVKLSQMPELTLFARSMLSALIRPCRTLVCSLRSLLLAEKCAASLSSNAEASMGSCLGLKELRRPDWTCPDSQPCCDPEWNCRDTYPKPLCTVPSSDVKQCASGLLRCVELLGCVELLDLFRWPSWPDCAVPSLAAFSCTPYSNTTPVYNKKNDKLCHPLMLTA